MSQLQMKLLTNNKINSNIRIEEKMATYRQGAFSKYAVKFALLAAGSVLLSACSSSIGSDEFGCSGIPSNGIKCISAKDAYEVTNYDGEYVPPYEAQEESKGKTRSTRKSKGKVESSSENKAATVTVRDRVIEDYVTPNLPDRPIPIRTPAEVMRIWVAPWEDKSGDLITTGYVYTEIEARRWVIGDAAHTSSPSINPLR